MSASWIKKIAEHWPCVNDLVSTFGRPAALPRPILDGAPGSQVAVLPDDPLAHAGVPGITVVADETLLLKTLRTSLLDQHLDPLSERIRAEVKVGRRTLLGSVASGIAYAVLRSAPALPGPS